MSLGQAFWRAALPALFSVSMLAAALALLLLPRFHFQTAVSLRADLLPADVCNGRKSDRSAIAVRDTLPHGGWG